MSSNIFIPLYPIKDTPVELNIQAFISLPGSLNFHVFEVVTVLPSFSSYIQVDQLPPQPPVSTVTFVLKERMQRIIIWVEENFLIQRPIECVDNVMKV